MDCMNAMGSRIWIGIWLLLAAGFGLAAERSPEAVGFYESLGRHNREADYRAMADWVFKRDITDEVRRQRVDEAVWVLTDYDSKHLQNDDKEVWADDFLSRLEKEAGDKWWAWSAAGDLLSELNGSGERVDGKFVRKSRGSISSGARDAARMRQCYVKALAMAEEPEDRAEIALKLAAAFDEGEGAEVLVLTDLAVLPELSDESPRGKWSWDADDFLVDGRSPVIGPDGRWRLPVLRERFEDATTDYERVYGLLNEAGRISPAHAARAKLALAEMWNELLGVHGLVSAGYVYIEGTSDPAEDGEFELATLKDEETILIGVNGPERRTVPAECRAVTMLRELVEDAGTPPEVREEALVRLTEVLADRYQFDAMKEVATRVAARYPEVGDASDYLVNIGPDGRFATCESFVVGEEVAVIFISREISEQRFELWRMDVEKYVAENGSQTLRGFDSGPWGASTRDFEKYQPFFQRVADWTAPVKRRGNHLQSATRIKVPVTEGGNYLVVTRLGDRWEVLPVQVARTIVLSAALDARFDDDGPDTWDSAGEADLFLIDALSGEPVEGAVAVAGHGRSEAISDHTGFLLGMGGGGEVLVRRPGLSPELLAVEDGEMGVQAEDEIRSFLVTNQPLYRPGQRVDCAGWLKRPNGRSAEADRFEEDSEAWFKVVDPVGQVIHEVGMALDEFGGFAGNFKLPSEMVLGDCEVHLSLGYPSSEDPFAEKSRLEMKWDKLDDDRWTIQVGEFRKPDFRVEVEAGGGGDGIAAVVKAAYHSGEAVKGAAVKARLRAYPTRSQVFPKLEWDDLYEAGYDWELPRATWMKDWQSWGIWPEEDDWENDELYYGDEVIFDATGVTDEEGRARLVFPEKLPLLGHYEYDCTVRVGVQEFTGRSVGAESDFIYSGREHEVLIKPERGFYREGETVKLQLWAMSAVREPVLGSGKVRVEAVAADGGLTEICSEDVTTPATGRAEVEFEPPAAGQYRCVFQAGGGERGFVLEVIGDKPASGRYDGVQLTPSRAVGAVGDRVEVLIQTEEDEARVWFFEQMPDGRKRTPRLIETRNRRAVVEVPLTKAGVPEFFLQAATVVKGRLKKATCRIVMPPVETKLNVTLSADPPRGEPGDEVKVAIAVTDAAGKPAEASLAVTAFDRALEDLGGTLPKAGDRMRDRFEGGYWPASSQDRDGWQDGAFAELYQPGCFFERGDLTGDPRRQAASRFEKLGTYLGIQYEPPELPNSIGGGAGIFPVTPATPTPSSYSRPAGREVELSAAEKAQMKGVGARKNFADRAYWGAALRTDKDGKVRAAFDLPDNLTAWRVQSWAFGKGRTFGDAQLDLEVSKPLQVRPLMPQAAVVGDVLVIGAMVQNLSGTAQEFQVTMEADGVKAPPAQALTLSAGEEGKVQWTVTLAEAGSVVFRFRARSSDGSLADGAEMPLPVAPLLTPVTVAAKAEIGEGMHEARLDLAFDEAVGKATLQVRLEAHPAVGTLAVLPDLVGYPYGCTEQTLNRFLPTLVAWQAAEKLGIDWGAMQQVFVTGDTSLGWVKGRAASGERPAELSAEKVRGMIHVGLKRLEGMQGDNGAWDWLSAEDQGGSPYMTALAVRGIGRARGLGFALQNDPAKQGISWLENWALRRAGVVSADPKKIEALDAWVAFVLSDAGGTPTPELKQALLKAPDQLTALGLVHLALAIDGKTEQADLQRLLAAIPERMEEEAADTRHTQEAVELRAWHLKLRVKSGAGKAELERGIRELLKQRRDGIRWSSTKDSALCVEAIIEAAIACGGLHFQPGEVVEATVSAAGQPRTVRLNRTNLWSATLEFPIDGGSIPGNSLQVAAARDGNLAVMVSATMSFDSASPARMVPAEDGIGVERNYYRVAAKGQRKLLVEGEKLKIGELVEVELILTAADAPGYVHMCDPVPAGLEPLMQLSGYESGAYRENRTGETDFFISALSPWNRAHRYHLRAVTAGESLALPARAECMYAPEVSGQSGQRRIGIEP